MTLFAVVFVALIGIVCSYFAAMAVWTHHVFKMGWLTTNWHSPKIEFNGDGTWGVDTGWLLTAPYLQHKWIVFGPRATAITARIERFEHRYVAELSGFRSWLIRHFGQRLLKHPRFELWRWNWTIYRIKT